MQTEPCARTTQLLAFRSAAVTLWGTPGWQDALELLSVETREALVTDGLVVAVGWVPERHLMELAEAIYRGPSEGSMDIYRAFIDRVIALGFGRVRRMLVQFASPATVLKRAPELWHHDHTHGELTVELGERTAIARLDHEVLTSTPLSRATAAEMFRSILTLTRAREVEQEHDVSSTGGLEVALRWA